MRKTLFFGLLAGCISSLSVLQAADDAQALVKQENRSAAFNAVAQELDLGGVHYSFQDFEGLIPKMGKQLNNIFQDIQAMSPDTQMQIPFPIKLDPILKALGLYQIEAIGQSSFANNHLYRNKTFIYMPTGQDGIFTITGTSAQPFTTLKELPTNTDLAYTFRFSGKALFQLSEQISIALLGDQGPVILGNMLGQPVPHMGEKSIREIIETLDTEITLAIRLDGTLEIPQAKGRPALNIPKPEFMLMFEGIGDLLASLENEGGPLHDLPSKLEGDVKIRPLVQFTLSGNDPYTQSMDPIYARNTKTGRVYFASHNQLFQESLNTDSGLPTTQSYKQATAGLPTEGNSILYVSNDLQTEMIALREQLVSAVPQSKFVLSIYGFYMPILGLEAAKGPAATVSLSTDQGLLNVANWPYPLQGASMGSNSGTTFATVGLMAAMAIPAFNKVRDQSREKTVINHLRMVAAGGQQYILEEGASKVSYPQLVEAGYFVAITPIAGESYDDLVVVDTGGTLTVTMASGKSISFEY